MFEIFSKNLFEDIALLPILKQLLGIAENKPFECVGTYDEVQVALALTLDKYLQSNEPLPVLLDFFASEFKGKLQNLRNLASDLLKHRNLENLIPYEYRNQIGLPNNAK